MKVILGKTDVFIDDGKYTVFVILDDNKKGVEVGGDNIEIIGYSDYMTSAKDYRYK